MPAEDSFACPTVVSWRSAEAFATQARSIEFARPACWCLGHSGLSPRFLWHSLGYRVEDRRHGSFHQDHGRSNNGSRELGGFDLQNQPQRRLLVPAVVQRFVETTLGKVVLVERSVDFDQTLAEVCRWESSEPACGEYYHSRRKRMNILQNISLALRTHSWTVKSCWREYGYSVSPRMAEAKLSKSPS